jgi:polar amino acid transport system permease protein
MRTFGVPEFLFILEAARWTLALSAIAFVGGAILGLVVALARSSENKIARLLSGGFIQIFQGTPLLLQLFLIFFGAPVLGLDVDPWIAAGIALILNSAAFLGEIWRGCIEAIPRGQWEAALALNLGYASLMRDVVLPQAFKIALPPTVGYLVQIIKGTSLAAIIGFTEVTRAGQIINNATFQPLHVFATVAAIYFVICWPLSLLAARLERRHVDPHANFRANFSRTSPATKEP